MNEWGEEWKCEEEMEMRMTTGAFFKVVRERFLMLFTTVSILQGL